MPLRPTKPKHFKVKSPVIWKWLGREILGRIISVHTESITKTIKGKNIKRNGSTENPAYVVESEAGNLALKLQSELFDPMESTKNAGKKAPKKSSLKTPTMFSGKS